MDSLPELLAPYGAPPDAVLPLDENLAPRERLEYADLLNIHPDERPDAIAKVDGSSIAYIVRSTETPCDPERIRRLRKMLAQRDDAPCLVIVEAACLRIYAIDLDRLTGDEALFAEIARHEARASSTFRLLHQEPPARERAIHELLFGLMTRGIDELHGTYGLSRSDAIALSGRALFIRCLLDRGVIGQPHRRPRMIARGARRFSELFSSQENAQHTCAWIDRTFNGDFLPLSEGLFQRLSRDALDHLEAILRREGRAARVMHQDRFDFDPVETDLDTPFSWDELDFAHIPVGILSQVYEYQAERWTPGLRQNDSIYYTPRRIAEYMVREAFTRLEAQLGRPAWNARVLDPAVGGGVFLVAAYRELCAAWHRHHGRWPTSQELRRILYEQVAGFDIQADALSLTSLSLYLTAIELDHPPYRLPDLRFDRPLRGNVLFDVADPDNAPGAPMPGSLGPRVPASHTGRYDLVIANPPWTSLPGPAGQRVIDIATATIHPTVTARLSPERAAAFAIPDKVPDLPFVWRAMQWARPGSVLAFALHGRLLFKTSPVGQRARADLIEAITIWGLLNGADLRLTPVWPEVDEPFCLLFADNAPPPADHLFYVASPWYEPGLNNNGRLRIDPDAMCPIANQRLIDSPWLLKALFRGTGLDVHLIERLHDLGLPTLAQWWSAAELASGDGYQRSSTLMDASHLLGLPHLTTAARPGLLIDAARLPDFAIPRLHRTRDEAIYRGPLLLLRESVRVDARRVHISDQGLVYNESFYGYSAHGHPESELLVRYLALLLSSRLFEWYNLVTGGKFGVEREVWHKVDVDAFPLMPLDRLDAARKAEVMPLFDAFAAGRVGRDAVDAWVLAIYDLGLRAGEVIADTLAMASPHQASMQHAAGRPEPAMIEAFAARVRERLRPFAAIEVRVVPGTPGDPYQALVIAPEPTEADAHHPIAQRVLQLADRLGSSEYVLTDDTAGRIWLGRLAQRRYWTLSRARLTAAHLLDGPLGRP